MAHTYLRNKILSTANREDEIDLPCLFMYLSLYPSPFVSNNSYVLQSLNFLGNTEKQNFQNENILSVFFCSRMEVSMSLTVTGPHILVLHIHLQLLAGVLHYKVLMNSIMILNRSAGL